MIVHVSICLVEYLKWVFVGDYSFRFMALVVVL